MALTNGDAGAVYTILVAGHVCLDLTPSLGSDVGITPGQLIEVGSLQLDLGGCVGNTGRCLVDAGARTRMSAAIGDDDLGAIVAALLAKQGADADALSIIPGHSTSYSLVIQSDGSDRTFWHHTGANASFSGDRVEFGQADLLHIGYPSLLPGLLKDRAAPLRELLTRARASGLTTSLDLAVVDTRSRAEEYDWNEFLDAVLPLVDVLSPSLVDLTSALRIDEPYSKELVERLTANMVDRGAGVVALSAGSHGMHLRTASRSRLLAAGRVLSPLALAWADHAFWQPALTVPNRVTTNGAGDASSAGFLFGLATGADPVSTGLIAASFAAAVIAGRRTTPDAIFAAAPSIGRFLGATVLAGAGQKDNVWNR